MAKLRELLVRHAPIPLSSLSTAPEQKRKTLIVTAWLQQGNHLYTNKCSKSEIRQEIFSERAINYLGIQNHRFSTGFLSWIQLKESGIPLTLASTRKIAGKAREIVYRWATQCALRGQITCWCCFCFGVWLRWLNLRRINVWTSWLIQPVS